MAKFVVGGFAQDMVFTLAEDFAWALRDSVMRRLVSGKGFTVQGFVQVGEDGPAEVMTLWVSPSTPVRFALEQERRPKQDTSPEDLDKLAESYEGYVLDGHMLDGN